MRLKSALRRGVAAAVIAGIVVSSGIPAYAGIWNIADGDITVKGASDGSGNYNKVKQGDNEFEKDEGETVITSKSGKSEEHTVTIDTSKGNVDVTFDDLKIDVSGKGEAAVRVEGNGHDATIELDGDNELKSGGNNAGLEKNEQLSQTSRQADHQGRQGQGRLPHRRGRRRRRRRHRRRSGENRQQHRRSPGGTIEAVGG